MEEFKPRTTNKISQPSFATLRRVQMSLRTHWGIWVSVGVIVAIIVTLSLVLISHPGRVAPYSGWSEPSDSEGSPSVLSSDPSDPSISGFPPESSQVHFSSPKPTPSTSEVDSPSSHGAATRDTVQLTMRDLEGTYSATSNGVRMTLTVYDADSDTAYARLSSTNAGTTSCAVAFLGDTLLLVFPDSSELRLRVNGRNTLTFVSSGTTLRRR